MEGNNFLRELNRNEQRSAVWGRKKCRVSWQAKKIGQRRRKVIGIIGELAVAGSNGCDRYRGLRTSRSTFCIYLMTSIGQVPFQQNWR